MLLSNYSDLDYIFDLDFDDFKALVEKMIESNLEEQREEYEKDIEDKLFFRWVFETTYMEKRPSFDEYKKMLIKKPKPKPKPKEITEEENIELIKRIEKVRKIHQGKSGE